MQPKITRREIARITAKAFGITSREVHVSAGRWERLSYPRFAIASLIKEFRPETKLAQIAQIIGYRDHTSVLHGIRKTAELIAQDSAFAHCVQEARNQIIAWKPGDATPDASVVFAPGHRATIVERPPAVKSVAPSAFAFLAERFSQRSVSATLKEAAQ